MKHCAAEPGVDNRYPVNTTRIMAVTTRLMWLSGERTNLIKVCDGMAASLVSAMRDRKPEALILPALITGDTAG